MATTVRINELPPVIAALSPDDMLPLWTIADGKTRQISIRELNAFISTGGSGQTVAPVFDGGYLIYIPPAIAVGTDTASIPSIATAGSFHLRRGGQPLIPKLATTDPNYNPDYEFEILSSGGFRLTAPGDALADGERFELDMYELRSTAPGPSSPASGSLIKGAVAITANLTINATNHLGKLLQFRANSTAVTVTLPSVSDFPENAIIPFEANINNTVQNAIVTSGGQKIYMGNTEFTTIIMSPGEVCWLLCASDGWYVINNFWDNYRNMARPYASYDIERGELLCKGQLLSRIAYPRLWEKVHSLGASLVTDAKWNTAAMYRVSGTWTETAPVSLGPDDLVVDNPYKGCFSTGDGTTTFRVPDLMGQALRGVISESGTDPLRPVNKPGGRQADMVGPHGHELNTTSSDMSSNDGADPVRGTDPGTSNTRGDEANSGGTGFSIMQNRGTETIMRNSGVFWVIKY
jgi:hypothetical protein